jgi:L-ascorbate metabolism protein UlaG (beta-lactamase superfamily)
VSTRARWLRRLGRWLLCGLAGLLGVLALSVAVALACGRRAFGKRAEGARQARAIASPEWGGHGFVNPQPLRNDLWLSLRDAFYTSPVASPTAALPIVREAPSRFDSPPPSGLRATWFGHSTVLLEIGGARILIDPIWSERASPFGGIGPQRWYPAPLGLADLPALDAVLISHDHYDHLDQGTILALKDSNASFVVPLGVGAHLEYWGIPPERIIELDWWQRTSLRGGALEIVCTPARHASGRMIVDDDSKLWAGYALLGAAQRVYYSGDTGLFPALREIGERLGPFDLTLIEIGQYGRSWPDWHLGPEQAVRAHQMVRGRVLLPVHWGALALAYHGWTEPIERTLVAGAAAGVTLVVPRPGQSIEPSLAPPIERWWPDVPWKTGTEAPIVATQMD